MCATTVSQPTQLPLWLSVEEFAEAVGISTDLTREHARTGLIEAHEHGRRRFIRIHRDEVPRYLDATLIRPTTDADTAPGSTA